MAADEQPTVAKLFNTLVAFWKALFLATYRLPGRVLNAFDPYYVDDAVWDELRRLS